MMEHNQFDFEDEPFFYAPLVLDESSLVPSSGFAPLYMDRNGGDLNVVELNPLDVQIPWRHGGGGYPYLHGSQGVNPVAIEETIVPLVDTIEEIKVMENDMNNYDVNVGFEENDAPSFGGVNPIGMEHDVTVGVNRGMEEVVEIKEMGMEEGMSRPKKKRKKSDGELPEPSEVLDIEDVLNVLVTMDSESFDDYVNQISSFREIGLTNDENNLVKDMRRKIKNRESARKCRQNKKNKMELLEEKN